MRIQLGLHARSEPSSDWHSKLLALQCSLETEQVGQELLQLELRHAAAVQRAAHAGQHKPAAGTREGARTLVPSRRVQRSG